MLGELPTSIEAAQPSPLENGADSALDSLHQTPRHRGFIGDFSQNFRETVDKTKFYASEAKRYVTEAAHFVGDLAQDIKDNTVAIPVAISLAVAACSAVPGSLPDQHPNVNIPPAAVTSSAGPSPLGEPSAQPSDGTGNTFLEAFIPIAGNGVGAPIAKDPATIHETPPPFGLTITGEVHGGDDGEATPPPKPTPQTTAKPPATPEATPSATKEVKYTSIDQILKEVADFPASGELGKSSDPVQLLYSSEILRYGNIKSMSAPDSSVKEYYNYLTEEISKLSGSPIGGSTSLAGFESFGGSSETPETHVIKGNFNKIKSFSMSQFEFDDLIKTLSDYKFDHTEIRAIASDIPGDAGAIAYFDDNTLVVVSAPNSLLNKPNNWDGKDVGYRVLNDGPVSAFTYLTNAAIWANPPKDGSLPFPFNGPVGAAFECSPSNNYCQNGSRGSLTINR